MEEMVAFLFPKAMLGEHDVWPMLYGCAGGMEYDGCGLLDVDNSDDEVITPWPRKTKIDFCQSSSERLPVWKLSFVNKKVHFQKFELILSIQVIPESIICRLKILLKDNLKWNVVGSVPSQTGILAECFSVFKKKRSTWIFWCLRGAFFRIMWLNKSDT